MDARITLRVDGDERPVTVDTRTTLLDALRERLAVTSPKKGCDHGQCGACTVLLDGRRIVSCLTFAVAHDGSEVTTANGLPPGGGDAYGPPAAEEDGGALHPVQDAFIKHDGFQCGYCTPGQICSAVGMLAEAAAGHPSAVTAETGTGPQDGPPAPAALDDEEIRERMNGNLCRCGAYTGILDAIREVAAR